MDKYKLYILNLLMVSALTSAYFINDKLWHGTIKFPLSCKEVPAIRIYYAGFIIPTEIQKSTRQLCFDIPESAARTSFYLLIADHVDFSTEQNTIQYLQVQAGQPYKLYHLEFIPNKEQTKSGESKVAADQLGTWAIEETSLPASGRVPDNTIIICYHPLLIKGIEGGSGLDLPKILINEMVINELSQDELEDASTQFLLTSLNCDTIHARHSEVRKKGDSNKNIISMVYS